MTPLEALQDLSYSKASEVTAEVLQYPATKRLTAKEVLKLCAMTGFSSGVQFALELAFMHPDSAQELIEAIHYDMVRTDPDTMHEFNRNAKQFHHMINCDLEHPHD